MVAILARIVRGCRRASIIARCLPSSWLDSLARVCGRHSCSRWRGLLLYMCHSVLAVQRLLMLLPEHWEDARPPSTCLSCSHWWPPFSLASAGAVAVPASSHAGRAGGHNSCSRPFLLLLEGGIVVAVSLRAGRAETADARAVGCMASQYAPVLLTSVWATVGSPVSLALAAAILAHVGCHLSGLITCWLCGGR